MAWPEGLADVRRVGAGGLGDVYVAMRESTGTEVAVKVVREQAGGHEEVLRRANREREALASLRGHPNVVHLEDVLVTDRAEVLLVMEYMAAGPIDGYAKRFDGTMPLDEVVLVGESAVSALSAAHGLGIVHRDIKPQNLLINGFGHVKVCDFGISSLGASAEFANRTDAISYRFASPEELRGDETIGPRTDVYSLGVTLGFLLTGRYVNHETASQLLDLELSPGLAEQDATEAEVELRELLVSCLASQVEDRPDSEAVARRIAAIGARLGDRARRLIVDPRVFNDDEVVRDPSTISGLHPIVVPIDETPATAARNRARRLHLASFVFLLIAFALIIATLVTA